MKHHLTGALAALLLAAPDMALAQTAEDPVGSWHGDIATPMGDLTLVLTVEREDDGDLVGKLESRDQAPGRLTEVDDLVITAEELRFGVARINATYSASWNEAAGRWDGQWVQGQGLPLALEPGEPDPDPVIEGLDGTWTGEVVRNGVTLRQVLRIATGDDGTAVFYDSPDQMIQSLPIADLSREGADVGFSIYRGVVRFDGTLDGDTITGKWTAENQPDMDLVLTRGEAQEPREAKRPQLPVGPLPYEVEEVEFDNASAGHSLAGTLTLPEGEGPHPAAILISGSGPQDRDESLLGHKPFAVLADHLTRNGIAVLRFDDRGVGGSGGDFAAATSADHATDANAAFAFLEGRDDIAADAIGFIGHSEGGMIGPIAMRDNDAVAFLVMLAGPGTRLDQLLLLQRRLMGAQMGMSEEEIDRGEPVMKEIFAAIGAATSEEQAAANIRAILDAEAMQALGLPADADPALVIGQMESPWYAYLLRYDPRPNLEAVDVPVLAINGTLDLQVPAQDNLSAIRVALARNPDVTVRQLDGLNHLFQTATTGSVGEYRDIEETFDPAALEVVSDWLRARFLR
ncbi:alpha/beta hydrolase family protein [Sphingomicrobium aestuariivivum]|uniref:alpha/beta hydrolase family protein n=1 Tax=Sphingomicrobium aestuariivivum TaxID=1582356 RepID=UPI001FD70860|nr:alpha/beta hydrolase [Sphingomicrobium aestuariivivum]MCJ8190991.1 alpha/beta hydrolase [Sphingomicrobium aestuariivivum]